MTTIVLDYSCAGGAAVLASQSVPLSLGAAVDGVLLSTGYAVIAGDAGGGSSAPGQVLAQADVLLPGLASGAASAPGGDLSVSAILIPGAATVGGTAVAPGATLTVSPALVSGAATGAAAAPGALTWSETLSLIAGAAAGESAGSMPGAAPGAALSLIYALLAGEASGVVVDDYPMKYAILADMVTRFGQTELAQLTDTVNMPPSTIDTARVQIAINDAQMEIDSAVGRIYRLPLSGCIRPPVPPGTEPTAVAPPQLTRLACDIARFFLYDDLAPENEVVRRYKQAKATLEDIANGDLQLACPWGGSPGELIGTDAQSGSAEVYDCFSPRQITDDTLRGF